MPLLYGKGPEKAFRRLQNEILAGVDDNNMFAWYQQQHNATRSVLASGPADFASSGPMLDGFFLSVHFPVESSVLTNNGLKKDVLMRSAPKQCTNSRFCSTTDTWIRATRLSLCLRTRAERHEEKI